MTLAAGQRLGPYEITGMIGAGGMGEVYDAIDTRLNRRVAVKILPPDYSVRADRQGRFALEAKALSSLSHPHICSLYDLGEVSGTRYLVMERLEGETLYRRLKRGPLPIAEALRVAIQAGEALEHAHRRGLLHRDLKPENMMLTGAKGATVKLLDFGLAKPITQEMGAAAPDGHVRSTQTRPLTAEGTLVGTFQYMAPEILEGGEASVRTDIFAFGAVLYESIAGRKAFDGGSRASLIASILKDQPPPIPALESTPSAALDRTISKCIAKDPDERWQSARDLVDELKWIAAT